MPVSPEDCAMAVLDVVPLAMRAIRTEMRRHRGPDLSVPMFRALAYLGRHGGASLSDVAAYLGVTLPSMSKMIGGLVTNGLVIRERAEEDRRRVTLELTPRGHDVFTAAYQATLERLADGLSGLPEASRSRVVTAMEALRSVFGGEDQPRVRVAGRDRAGIAR